MRNENGVFYSACIAGNITGPHYREEKKEIRNKALPAGANVYGAFVYGGMEHKRLRAFGKPRRTRRIIDSAIDTRYSKNFRPQKIV